MPLPVRRPVRDADEDLSGVDEGQVEHRQDGVALEVGVIAGLGQLAGELGPGTSIGMPVCRYTPYPTRSMAPRAASLPDLDGGDACVVGFAGSSRCRGARPRSPTGPVGTSSLPLHLCSTPLAFQFRLNRTKTLVSVMRTYANVTVLKMVRICTHTQAPECARKTGCDVNRRASRPPRTTRSLPLVVRHRHRHRHRAAAAAADGGGDPCAAPFTGATARRESRSRPNGRRAFNCQSGTTQRRDLSAFPSRSARRSS